MPDNLRQCVDCGKVISSMATSCNGCNCPDPFGFDRAKTKFQNQLTFAGLIVAIVVGFLWYTGFIDPLHFLGFTK